jgi:hypothetical protein
VAAIDPAVNSSASTSEHVTFAVAVWTVLANVLVLLGWVIVIRLTRHKCHRHDSGHSGRSAAPTGLSALPRLRCMALDMRRA